MYSTKVDPKYNPNPNPRIGLIALASDFMIEKDFINVIKDKDIDFFVNRIECYNPLTRENLIKMSLKVTEVTKDILPDEKIDCVVYACTSGTIAAGYNSIEKKVKLAKPEAKVTTPSTAAIKALKKLKIQKLSIFTPYSKKLNDEVVEYFKEENFNVTSNSYFDIESDIDIGKVDQNYLYEVLSKIELKDAPIADINDIISTHPKEFINEIFSKIPKKGSQPIKQRSTAAIESWPEEEKLTEEEIKLFVLGLTDGSFSDSQIASMSMAIYLNGMTKQETNKASASSKSIFESTSYK